MTGPLCVLLISGEYPPMEGGVADFTHLVGREMALQGHEVHVLTSTRAGPAREVDGVICHPVLAHWGWRALDAALRRLLDEVQPAVLNIQYQTAAYGMHPAINLLPTRYRRVPTVVTFHDLLIPYLFPKAGRVRWWVNLALARGSRAVIVTNAQDEERLRPYPWMTHLTRIPIGSNIACSLPAGYDRAAWRAHWGVEPDALLLCYFGFLNASKGGEELILALAHLVRAGYDARLVMIGGNVGASDLTNQAYLGTVRRLIEEYHLAQRVIWTGYLAPEEVSAGLCAADLCVLPYRDGASFRRGSLMAALAHGLPIISTQPEVTIPELAHGGNIWLVPPYNPGALGEAAARLAGDAALRQRLGAGAWALAAEFAWPQIASRTLEVYYAVVAR